MSKSDFSGTFTLGADTFTWLSKHYSGEVSPDSNFRGLSARVCLADAKCRELVIEFDAHDYPLNRPASVPQFAARIKEYTQKAIDAGWRPDSRGKPYRLAADRLPK